MFVVILEGILCEISETLHQGNVFVSWTSRILENLTWFRPWSVHVSGYRFTVGEHIIIFLVMIM